MFDAERAVTLALEYVDRNQSAYSPTLHVFIAHLMGSLMMGANLTSETNTLVSKLCDRDFEKRGYKA
jgi:hypothetical protein